MRADEEIGRHARRVVGGAGTGMLLQLKRIIQLPGDEAKLPITQGAGGKWVGKPGTDQDDPGDVTMLTRALSLSRTITVRSTDDATSGSNSVSW